MRQCGDCQLCCKLVPVKDIGKPANQRCDHQRTGKGCVLHSTPSMPFSCRMWNCAWLSNRDTADLSRPDRAHYVIDPVPDYITVRDNKTGEGTKIMVVQIWCDPTYPDAHRDPALRRFLERRGNDYIAALIRYDNMRGVAVFPPSMTGKDWVEIAHGHRTQEHSAADVYRAMQETGHGR